MRKRIVGLNSARQAGELDQGWLDLEQIATVEVTSEDPSFPVESAFDSKDGTGWRAAEKGEQRIRIIFDEPVSLRRIHVRFQEAHYERIQEFVISMVAFHGRPIPRNRATAMELQPCRLNGGN